ncbi:MAG: nitroreductase [Armatimonadetes bacterium]|nr:nitroreductase [Armatimonadota bacterium]
MSTLTDTSQTVFDAIANRRSMKVEQLHSDREVPREVLETVLRAADWAPSHGKTEPWRFTVFTGDGRRRLSEAFGEAYRQTCAQTFHQAAFEKQRDRVWGAPVWISVAMSPLLKPDGALKMPEHEELMAVAGAVENLHIMACALGLAGKWTTNEFATHPVVAQMLGLQAHERLLGFFFLGWPAEPVPQSVRRPLEEKVRWESA